MITTQTLETLIEVATELRNRIAEDVEKNKKRIDQLDWMIYDIRRDMASSNYDLDSEKLLVEIERLKKENDDLHDEISDLEEYQ